MVSYQIDRLVSVQEAARQLGLSPRRLRAAIREEELPAYQPGNRTVYLQWSELLRWLRSQQIDGSVGPKSGGGSTKGNNPGQHGASS
jgi:excisionase family DNA binding protein